MIRIFPATAFALALLLTRDLSAQGKSQSSEKSESPWAVDRSLVVSPQGEPAPAL